MRTGSFRHSPSVTSPRARRRQHPSRVGSSADPSNAEHRLSRVVSHLLDSWHAASFVETLPTHVIQTVPPHLQCSCGSVQYTLGGRIERCHDSSSSR